MKKRLALLLAAVLALGSPAQSISANAAVPAVRNSTDSLLTGNNETRASSSNGQSQEVWTGTTGEKVSQTASPTSETGRGTGWLRIQVQGVARGKDTEWDVALHPAGGEDGRKSVEGEFTLPAVKDGEFSEAELVIKDIPNGKYNLLLMPKDMDGSPYLTYEHEKEIDIQGDLTVIRLMDDFPESFYEGQKTQTDKIGVLAMGDLDGDGEIGDGDKEMLLDLVAGKAGDGSKSHSADSGRADLNGDGEIDLLDVACFAKYYKTDAAKRQAVPVKAVLVTSDDIKEATPSNATFEEGSLKELMAGEISRLAVKSEESISAQMPVVLGTEFTAPKTMGGFVIEPVTGSAGSIRSGEVEVVDENGKVRTFLISDGKVQEPGRARMAVFNAAAAVAETGDADAGKAGEEDGMLQGLPIVIDLKGQVPVKKIIIKVTATLQSTNLVDISRVEFLNNMEDRIPAVKMTGPEPLKVVDGDASFTVSWKKQPNVTGYRVVVSNEETAGKILETVAPTIQVTSLGDEKLVNGEKYKVEVYSVNGSWRSPSSTAEANPRATKLPPAPENLSVTGGNRRLIIGWKDMKDTDSYTLYYRKADDKNGEFRSVAGIIENRYELQGLEEQTKYELYLTGTNPLGEGPASIHYTGTTVSVEPPVTPNYKLINTPVTGSHTAHIESVAYGGADGHEFDVVDGDYATSWVRDDWDAGYHYPGENKSPIVTLDQEYEMDTVALIPDEVQAYALAGVRIDYWDAENNKQSVRTRLYKKESNNKTYYMVQADHPFTAKRVQLAMTTGYSRRLSVAEYKFYYYDSLESDILGLYTDNYHVSLREDVTQSDIDALRRRLETKDEVSGELHPKSEILEAELVNAERVLKEGSSADDIMAVDNKDTERADSHITFRGGLNVYQPLGVTVRAGDTITVYAGGPRLNVGDNTSMQLIAAQYHGSSNAVFKSLGALKAGPNEFTVGSVDNMDLERGGQLYVAYTGGSGAEEYGVRVVGGTRIPVLDLSDVSLRTVDDPMADEQCREKLLAYVDALEDMSGKAEQLHRENHTDYEWDPRNCVYEATDIVTRYTMLSVGTDRVLEGLGAGDREEKARKLGQSMKAMDEMMYLFYQHKGLSEDPAAPAHNRVPISRINIRYQRMFAGAFMYAGGRHIGIEWPEIAGMVSGRPVERDENGKWIDGQYFGWGIAHEIGHEINEGAYAVAETTNNYFSLLAQARDNNTSVRFTYDKVFDKVTSGTKGKASNVFVQLAMYWQLHLAYDNGYNFKIYDTNKEQMENLFFARTDSYARKISEAPGGLSLNGADTDNKLMRLAMASARKNLLAFFEHWGMEPDEGTIAYAKQFEEETRGIWFANDENRVARIEAGAYQNVAQKTNITGSIDYQDGSNEVTLHMSAPEAGGDIWIYEIYRYERIKDGIERRPAGYAEASGGEATFTDVIGTTNNHTFTYEIIGYDQWLNPTKKVEIGSVKVCHDGTLDNSLWELTTNLTNSDLEGAGEDDPETPHQPDLELMIDSDPATSFTGSTEGAAVPEIIIHLNDVETVTGLKYTASEGTPIGDLKVYVSETGTEWTEVKTHADGIRQEGAVRTIHFTDGRNLYTYDASYVKVTAPGQGGKNLTVSELSLLGETGDDVSLEGAGGIGILSEDYVEGEAVIPKGSLIFTGTYKGNPAFNTVLLWDENGRIVGGAAEDGSINAEEIIFAPDPENGMLGEVSDGFWVYYIGAEHADELRGKRVRAELYRVDDAQTQEGERLVSSTMFVEVPVSLPSIKLDKGTGGSTQ